MARSAPCAAADTHWVIVLRTRARVSSGLSDASIRDGIGVGGITAAPREPGNALAEVGLEEKSMEGHAEDFGGYRRRSAFLRRREHRVDDRRVAGRDPRGRAGNVRRRAAGHRWLYGCYRQLPRFARVARLLHGVKRAAGLWETRDARQ